MTTYKTDNKLGSAAPKDLFDNAENLDVFANDRNAENADDRFGNKRLTWHGIEKQSQRAMSRYGYITKTSFELGNTLDTPNSVLQWAANGEFYRWDGDWSEPKVVPAGSTPMSTGGIGDGKWKSIGDSALRTQLSSGDGAGAIGSFTYAQLRAYKGDSDKVSILGRAHLFDFAKGDFLCDKNDKVSPDNDGTVLIDALGRRWKRSPFTSADIRWWGVTGDGVTPDASKLNNAIHSYKNLIAWPEAKILLERQYNDGTPNNRQGGSYSIDVKLSCILDLNGGTLIRDKVGDGDNIMMAKVFKITTRSAQFIIKNGIIDMNNHNARFALFHGCADDSGIFDCNFINTRNNGTPRTVIPDSSELIIIRNTKRGGVDNCNFYAGSQGDMTGNGVASFDHTSFCVRIMTTFVTKEENQTESTTDCFITNCKAYGPFTWQAFEIAGTGTRGCYMQDIYLHRPVLSMIDLDKGCKRCWARNITINAPQYGVPESGSGGNELVVARFQGYKVGDDVVYAEDCWIENVRVTNADNSKDLTSGSLVENNWAKRCTATNVKIVNGRIPVLARMQGVTADTQLTLIDVGGEVNYIYRGQTPHLIIKKPDLSVNYPLSVSTAYLNDNPEIEIYGGTITAAQTVNEFLDLSENNGKQAKIKVCGTVFNNFSRFCSSQGVTMHSKVFLLDVTSFSAGSVASTYATIPAANRSNIREFMQQ